MENEKTPAEVVKELHQWTANAVCGLVFMVGIVILGIWAAHEPVMPNEDDCAARGQVDCWRSEPR
jgi:hypothetical protein